MKIKILSLMTLLCAFFFSVSFAQTIGGGSTAEISKNTVKRSTCLSGYSGCSTVGVVLTLSGSGFSKPQTISSPDAGKEYAAYLKKIKITISDRSSSGTYYLPTTIGESVTIPATDGLTFSGHAYDVTIEKTGSKEFRLWVTDFDL